MAFVVFTRRNVAALKSSLRTALPAIGSAHADEALAAGIGFKTYAAMLAALKAQGNAKLTVVLNEWSVSLRLAELTGSKPDFEILRATLGKSSYLMQRTVRYAWATGGRT